MVRPVGLSLGLSVSIFAVSSVQFVSGVSSVGVRRSFRGGSRSCSAFSRLSVAGFRFVCAAASSVQFLRFVVVLAFIISLRCACSVPVQPSSSISVGSGSFSSRSCVSLSSAGSGAGSPTSRASRGPTTTTISTLLVASMLFPMLSWGQQLKFMRLNCNPANGFFQNPIRTFDVLSAIQRCGFVEIALAKSNVSRVQRTRHPEKLATLLGGVWTTTTTPKTKLVRCAQRCGPVPTPRAKKLDGSPLSNVVAARVPSPMHGGRLRWMLVGRSTFLLLSSSRVIPRPPAPARLHWLSDVAVGGPWAAPRARLTVIGVRKSLLQSNVGWLLDEPCARGAGTGGNVSASQRLYDASLARVLLEV